MFDIRKACRWQFPKLSYTNFKKKYPGLGDGVFTSWFSLTRYWSGRIWNINVKHHQISLDFRFSWLDDMVSPNATKEDRKAVNDAIKATSSQASPPPR